METFFQRFQNSRSAAKAHLTVEISNNSIAWESSKYFLSLQFCFCGVNLKDNPKWIKLNLVKIPFKFNFVFSTKQWSAIVA